MCNMQTPTYAQRLSAEYARGINTLPNLLSKSHSTSRMIAVFLDGPSLCDTAFMELSETT